MNAKENTIRHLAARVRNGDPAAAVELRQELQPHLRRIARRALRASSEASTVTARVRAAAERLAQGNSEHAASDPDRLAGPVARNLSESLVSRLEMRGGGQRMLETICD